MIDEEEEHHDPAGVDEDLHRADELRLLQDEDARRRAGTSSSRKSAEWIGLRSHDDATASASASGREDDEEPAGVRRRAGAGTSPRSLHPCSTTVNGLTFAAALQSVSLRMSR